MAGKTKGLGKGLGTLLGEAADIGRSREAAAPVTEEEKKIEQIVKLRLIEPNREQPRKDFDDETLQELVRTHVIQHLQKQGSVLVKRRLHLINCSDNVTLHPSHIH